jgi:hypothetical protein
MSAARSRRLPQQDPTIGGLDEASRGHACSTNLRRARLELQGAAAFTVVTQALIELRAPAAIVSLCASAIAEELRHSEIYVTLARAYGGGVVDAPRPSPIEVPRYPEAGADGERLLHVLGMCCVNETMACSFLELCFAKAVAPLAREGIRQILQDEIRHARVGWAYLGSADVGDAERRLASAWLLPMLRTQWRSWRDHVALLPEIDLAEHGCPSPSSILAVSWSSIRQLVLPGLGRAGVDIAEAHRWASAGPSP